MIQKSAIVLAAGAMLMPAQASFDGIQLGGQVGLQVLKGPHHYIRRPVAGGDLIADQRQGVNAISYLMGIQAAYLAELGTSKTLLGGEVYLVFPGGRPVKLLNNQANNPEGKFSVQHKSSMGLAFIVGMMLNPKVAVYGRLGFEMASFTGTYEALTTGSPNKFSKAKKANALVIGLGGTYKLNNHFLIGLELNVPFIKKLFFQSDNEIVDGRRMMLTYKPQEYRLGLKLMYRF